MTLPAVALHVFTYRLVLSSETYSGGGVLSGGRSGETWLRIAWEGSSVRCCGRFRMADEWSPVPRCEPPSTGPARGHESRSPQAGHWQTCAMSGRLVCLRASVPCWLPARQAHVTSRARPASRYWPELGSDYRQRCTRLADRQDTR